MNINLFRRSNQPNVKIKYFFMEIFQSIKFYAIRIDYQFLDYEQQNISWTFSTIKRAILFTLNSWLTIVYLFCLILWPRNDYLLSIETFDKIVYSNRNDFIIIEMIIVFVLRECLFYNYLKELIKYKSKLTEFLMKYCQYDDCELSIENQNHLNRFYKKSNLIATISYRILTIGLLSLNFVLLIFSFYLYECGQISLIKFIISSICFFSYISQCIYMVCYSFNLLISTVFGVEFFRIRLKQLSIKSMNLLKNSIQSSNLQRKLFWYRFHSYYVYLYSETDKFNQTIQEALLFLEMMSKSLVVICLLYYSHQTKMHLQNSLVTIILITVFCLINILNFRIAHIPLYNRVCWLSIHRWIARSQWSNMERKKHRNRLPLRYYFKSRLFLSIMTNNQFGFTCGRMFFISKFKYIQMFIMNFHMAIKFYKKICLSQNK